MALRRTSSRRAIGASSFLCCVTATPLPAGAGESVTALAGRAACSFDRWPPRELLPHEGVWAQAFEKLEQPRPLAFVTVSRSGAAFGNSPGTSPHICDCSSGHAEVRQSVGNVDIMPKDCHGKSLDEVVGALLSRSHDELSDRGLALPLDLLAVVIDYLVISSILCSRYCLKSSNGFSLKGGSAMRENEMPRTETPRRTASCTTSAKRASKGS